MATAAGLAGTFVLLRTRLLNWVFVLTSIAHDARNLFRVALCSFIAAVFEVVWRQSFVKTKTCLISFTFLEC